MSQIKKNDSITIAREMLAAMIEVLPPNTETLDFLALLGSCMTLVFGVVTDDAQFRRQLLAGWCQALQDPIPTHPPHDRLQ